MTDQDNAKLVECMAKLDGADAGQKYAYGCGFTDAIAHARRSQAEIEKQAILDQTNLGYAEERIAELEAKVARLSARGIEDMQHTIVELEAIVEKLLAACPRAMECNDFHHSPRDYHSGIECGPLRRYTEAIEAAEAALDTTNDIG